MWLSHLNKARTTSVFSLYNPPDTNHTKMEYIGAVVIIAALCTSAILSPALFVALVLVLILAGVVLKYLDVGQRCSQCSTPSLGSTQRGVKKRPHAPPIHTRRGYHSLTMARGVESGSVFPNRESDNLQFSTQLVQDEDTNTHSTTRLPHNKQIMNPARERKMHKAMSSARHSSQMSDQRPNGINLNVNSTLEPIGPQGSNLHRRQKMLGADMTIERNLKRLKSNPTAEEILETAHKQRRLINNPSRAMGLSIRDDPLSTVLWTVDQEYDYELMQRRTREALGQGGPRGHKFG